MKIFNKFIWSKTAPSNRNDIWFDGEVFRLYRPGKKEGEEWDAFTLPVDAATRVAKILENAFEVYQEKLIAGKGIKIENNTISTTSIFELVNKLPSTGEEGIIYLVPLKDSTDAENQLMEYIWIDSHWESIGGFKVNLDSGISFEEVASTEPTAEFPQLLYVPQYLSEEQKAQARENIGVGEGSGNVVIIYPNDVSKDRNKEAYDTITKSNGDVVVFARIGGIYYSATQMLISSTNDCFFDFESYKETNTTQEAITKEHYQLTLKSDGSIVLETTVDSIVDRTVSETSNNPISNKAIKEYVDNTISYDDSELRSLIENRQEALVSGQNIKTINRVSILGRGDITITGEGTAYDDSELRGEIGELREVTERRFTSAEETLNMLSGAFDNFSAGITPATIQTMALLVGDKSLQFKFTSSKNSLVDIDCPLIYDNSTKIMYGRPACLVHMTLGIDSLTSSSGRSLDDYKKWTIVTPIEEELEDTEARYIYVKASKNSEEAEYLLSPTSIKVDENPEYYHFLVGILNSEYDGSRDFVKLYGFTEVLPGQITTDIIKSADGRTYFDLQDGIICGSIKFITSDGTDKDMTDFVDDYNESIAGLDKAIEDALSDSKDYTDEGKRAMQEAIDELNNAKANAIDVYTKSAADNIINEAEQRAQNAAEEYTNAAKVAAITAANAYADGILTEAEAEILKTAKGYADAAQAAAEAHADGLEDGFISSAEEIAIEKAEQYANEAKRLAEETAAAYADGKVSEAEARAIAEAQTKVNAAKTELNAAIAEVEGIANTARVATTNLNTKVLDLETGVEQSIKEINDKLDGVVESYFDEYIPLKTNLPASEWIANGTESNHVGDTFTNTLVEGEGAGQSWRWLQQKDGTYDWQLIADSAATQALALAIDAKATADGKMYIFLRQPTKYNEGDLWIVGSDYIPSGYKEGDILNAIQSNTSYIESYWKKFVNYTDDTKANEIAASLANAIETLNASIEEARGEAADHADEIAGLLNERIYEVEKAKANIEDIYDKITLDGKISSLETDVLEAARDFTDEQNGLLQEYLEAYADGHISDAEGRAIAAAQEKVNLAKEELNIALGNLYEQLDGIVENHYLKGAPTIYNYPAIEWDTDVAKINHIGDLYINIDSEEQDPVNAGKGWRWCVCGEEENLGKYDEIVIPVGTTMTNKDVLVGKLNTSYAYINVQCRDAAGYLRPLKPFAYEQYIEVVDGPHIKVRIDKDGYVYILDVDGGYTNSYFTLRFYRSEALRAIDKDGNEVFLHWHPVVDTDKIKGLIKEYKIQTGVDEVNYLKRLFRKGETDIEGGVVLSNMLAVKEGENVEAFINGSDFGEDDTHGKLLIAAGIDDITNPNGANTRIYEDGTVETNRINLQEGCKVGLLEIGADSIKTNHGDNPSAEFGSMALYDSGISFDHLYRTNATPPYTYAQSRIITVNEQGLSAIINLYKGQPYSNPIIKIRGEGVVDAFEINNGTFAGLRTKTRVITSKGTQASPNLLTNLDFDILINSRSGVYYIALPGSGSAPLYDGPHDGQEYIITTKGADIVIMSHVKNIYDIEGGIYNYQSLLNKWYSEEASTKNIRGAFRIKYYKDADQWIITWIDKYEY